MSWKNPFRGFERTRMELCEKMFFKSQLSGFLFPWMFFFYGLMILNEIPLVFRFSLLQKCLERSSNHFRNVLEQNYEDLTVFLFYEMIRNGIPKKFLSSEWNYEVLSVFLFYEMVRNRIISILPSVEFFRTEFRKFSLSWKRRNFGRMSKNFLLFLVPREKNFLGKWQP